MAVTGAHLALGVLAGCDESTTGERVAIETRAQGAGSLQSPFETEKGWTISLVELRMDVASLVYFDGAPVVAQLDPRRRERRPSWRDLLAVPEALAHPGHYVEGQALGEMPLPASIDLLADVQVLAEAEGTTGTARSARLEFGEGVAVVARGTASADGEETRTFAVSISSSELLASDSGLPEVSGCVLENGDVQSDGTVTLTVDATVWFDQIDFSLVAPSDEEVELAMGEAPRNALARGIKKAIDYHFAFEPR